MDYKQTVDWLKSYKGIVEKIETIENDMQGVKGISYTNEASSTGKQKELIDFVIKKEELEKQALEIKEAVESVPNFYQRTVLEYKYINGRSFEWIAKHMHYSTSGVFKIHRKGIFEIIKRVQKVQK